LSAGIKARTVRLFALCYTRARSPSRDADGSARGIDLLMPHLGAGNRRAKPVLDEFAQQGSARQQTA
jgi:hypothetical protein